MKTRFDEFFSVRKTIFMNELYLKSGSRCQMNLLIRDRLVMDLADVALSKRLPMDPNLTLQRAIESARNSQLVKSEVFNQAKRPKL